MADPTKRRRFRFAFSLRTLFVLMTFCCVGLGWVVREIQIVNERKLLVELVENADGLAYPLEFGEQGWGYRPDCDACRVSAFRRFLGDSSYMNIELKERPEPAFANRICKAFTETWVMVYPKGEEYYELQRGCFSDAIEKYCDLHGNE